MALDLFSKMLGQVTDYILSNGSDPDEISLFVEESRYSTLITSYLEEMASSYDISFNYINVIDEGIMYTFNFKSRNNIINLSDYKSLKK